jgi:hypothetical protein
LWKYKHRDEKKGEDYQQPQGPKNSGSLI